MIVREFIEELATLASAQAKDTPPSPERDPEWARQLASCVDELFTMADANFPSTTTEPEIQEALRQALDKLGRSAPEPERLFALYERGPACGASAAARDLE
jgi:hypothetical protein